MSRYKISQANQYLIRTGLFIKDISISKKGFLLPFQKYKFIDMTPRNYEFSLHAMSHEKLEFVLPVVFTIGPKDEPHALASYSKFMPEVSAEQPMQSLDTIIKGVLEGETRLESAKMSIEDIFNNRQTFKETIIKNVQEELDQFGLKIYNANFKELEDSKGSEYFCYLRQNKKSQAENVAKIEVAENVKKGNIGQKEREAETRQRTAEFEATTISLENKKFEEIEKSKAALQVTKAEMYRLQEIAKTEAANDVTRRNIEMQKDIEAKRQELQKEKQRADVLAATVVAAEAKLAETKAEAESIQMLADASLYQSQKEALAKQMLYEVQAKGLRDLAASFGGNSHALIQFLMLEKNLYPELAKANAEAIQGLQPKIHIWNTGSDASNWTTPIADIFKTIPPLVTAINDQTGVSPPSWLATLSKGTAPTETTTPENKN